MIRSLYNALFLADKYLRSAPLRSAVLVLGTTVALFLPVFTFLAAEQVEQTLYARAEASPVLLGHKGNEFDLTMASLYFRGQLQDPIPWRARQLVSEADYGAAAGLYVRYTVSGAPLVGTELSYFRARGLEVAQGRLPAVLGEVVAGARVAREFNLSVGDTVRSDSTNLYNIAGAYPVVMEVVGVFEPTGTSDDQVFFADVKTTWTIDGLFHGHEEVTRADALNPEAAEGENLEATAAIFVFQEITETNRGSFHMHGDPGHAPLTSVMVWPRDQRAHDQLLGDYALDEHLQAVEPRAVMDTIFGIVLQLRDLLTVYFGVVAASTLAFFVLVTSLSLRLRRDEIQLMVRVGSGRWTIALLVGSETFLILFGAAVLTGGLTLLGLRLLATLAG